MKKLGNIPFYTLIIYILVGLVVTVTELPDIQTTDWELYLTGRALSILPALPLAFVLRKNPFHFWANTAVGILFTLYSIVGHYFRPFSYASYLEVIILYGILFFLPRKHFIWMMTLMTGMFMAFWLFTFGKVKYPISPAETPLDVIVVCLIAPLIALIIHHFFTAERGLKEEALSRFSLVGKHASGIIHDIKGSIGVPLLYFENVEQALNKGDLVAAQEQLSLGQQSLLDMSRRVYNLNQVSHLAYEDNEAHSLAEIVNTSKDILSKQLHFVDIRIHGDYKVHGDRGILISVFMNLFVNSIENFKTKKTADPQITIDITKDLVRFRDNGGGFSIEALKSLKAGIPTSDKHLGSGLGLYLIKENLKAFKAQVHFSNIENSAQAEISFSS